MNQPNIFLGYLYCGELLPQETPISEYEEFANKSRKCLEKLYDDLNNLTGEETEEFIQSIFYEAGKLHFSSDLRLWFSIVYWTILRVRTGPRMGAFTKIVGVEFVLDRINKAFVSPFF